MTKKIEPADLVEPQMERERLGREIASAEKELQGLVQRFENPEFLAHAPPEVLVFGKDLMSQLKMTIPMLRTAIDLLQKSRLSGL